MISALGVRSQVEGGLHLPALLGGATLLLLPLVFWRGHAGVLRAHWKAIAVVGITNSAIPFVLFSIAALAVRRICLEW